MKHLLRLSLLLSISALLAGCASQGVPSTRFTITDPASGAKVTYEGPKQVKLGTLSTSIRKADGTTVTVLVKDLSADNDPSVIQQSGTADAQRITATAGLVKEVGTTINTGLGTALGAAAKTVVPVP